MCSQCVNRVFVFECYFCVDSDLIGRQYCAMALGNLAAEPENHEDIVKLEGISALVALLKTEDVESG